MSLFIKKKKQGEREREKEKLVEGRGRIWVGRMIRNVPNQVAGCVFTLERNSTLEIIRQQMDRMFFSTTDSSGRAA